MNIVKTSNSTGPAGVTELSELIELTGWTKKIKKRGKTPPQMGGAVDLFDYYKKTAIRVLFQMLLNEGQYC